jgi:hypothetical protein
MKQRRSVVNRYRKAWEAWWRTVKHFHTQMCSTPRCCPGRGTVHEAGHVIACWYSSRVVHIERVTVGTYGGFVEYRVLPDFQDSRLARWSRVVVALGGIAGAFWRGHRVRAPHCRDDLVKAREAAAELAGVCDVHQALPVNTAGCVTISRMYADALSPPEQHVIEAAYLKARALLACYRAEHLAVALALYCLSELTSPELALLLGPRRIGKVFELRRERLSGLRMLGRLLRVGWHRLMVES